MGVLILVLYTVAANMDVHQASGLRILCGTLTNTVATVIFAVRGIIEWQVVSNDAGVHRRRIFWREAGEAHGPGARSWSDSGLRLERHHLAPGAIATIESAAWRHRLLRRPMACDRPQGTFSAPRCL